MPSTSVRGEKLKRRLSYDQLVRQRTRRIFTIFAIGYILLAFRLFYIQVIRAPFFMHEATHLMEARITLFARRGNIYDRNGNKLATTVDAYDVGIRPKVIKNKEAASICLAPLLGMTKEDVYAKLTARDTFFYMARRVDVEVGEAINKSAIEGVDVLRTTKRIYPSNTLAAHIIGYTNVDGMGISGLEKVYDKLLSGTNGYVIADKDAKGMLIPGSRKERVEPVDGKDIYLTIDSTLQHTLESELAKSYTAHSAAGASAVVVDPKTGEILALANMPTFDPNNIRVADDASRRNRAVTDIYEPGSTLKVVTACGALEDKAITTNDTFYCHGSTRIGNRTIRCSLHPPFMGGHGTSNVAKVLRYSCNIGAAAIGKRLGAEKLYKYEDAFGLYKKPGSQMLGEVTAWHDNWKDWGDVRLANIAFGQGIAVTPLQMAGVYSVVANGGNLMRPYVVKEIRNTDGTQDRQYGPRVVRRVVSEQTAGMVSEMLKGVVSDGTGKTAQVEGYTVAGKTGSAQKASTTGRGYAAGKFIASFAGFVPANEPRLVILVMVDEPKGTHWGATVAAPVFQGFAQRAMWYLKIPPDNLPEQPKPSTGKTGSDIPRSIESPDASHPRQGG